MKLNARRPLPTATAIVDMIVGANRAGRRETVLLRSSARACSTLPEWFRGGGPTSVAQDRGPRRDGDLDMVETMRGRTAHAGHQHRST